MRVAGLILTLGLCLLSAQTSVIVYQAQMGAMAGDLNFTRQFLAKVRNAIGVTPEYIEALS
ncbi:MAG TPA: hypothetical protein VHB50_07305 [Bryobacteraceae bacterium]|nr:hypothetical protein [Bryobacteraceae bacterium]